MRFVLRPFVRSVRSIGLLAFLAACSGDIATTPSTIAAPASASANTIPENPIIRAVALGAAFNTSCAILTTGPLVCWGWNHEGQIGDGSTTDRNIAVPVATSLRFTRVVVGARYTCALTLAGEAYCWGQNFWGALGDGTRIDHVTPAPVVGGLHFTDIASGFEDMCGLTGAGAVYCWGFLLNTSTLVDATIPRKMSGTRAFKSIAHGGYIPCGIGTDDVTYCFERTYVPELGDVSWRPVAVPNAPRFTSLSGQGFAMCGLTQAGVAYCWGTDPGGYGNLGSPNAGMTPTVPVDGNHVFAALYSAYDWSCGLTADKQNFCWGHNQIDTFGPNLPYVNPIPVAAPFPRGLSFTARASGWQSTCAISTTSAVYCWGVGTVGQLADGLGHLNDPIPHTRATPDYARRLP